MRIVSLLPSATEVVCCLGLGESLVAVTTSATVVDATARCARRPARHAWQDAAKTQRRPM